MTSVMPLQRPSDLQARKKVRLRLRSNVRISPQLRGGRTCFVAADPLTLRYFHFDENQQFILGLMDGSRALEEIRQAYEEKYRPRRLSLEELEDFAPQLLESNLVFNVSPGATRLTLEQ